MIRLVQYHSHASCFDAISNHMELIHQRALTLSFDSLLLADFISPGLNDFVPTPQFRPSAKDRWFIHFSLGNPHLEEVLKFNGPKLWVYHNITPASYFHFDLNMKKLSQLGEQQLQMIAKRGEKVLTVSEYNLQCLRERGFKDVELFPLLELPPSPSPVTPKTTEVLNLLFVGRISPHKRQDLLIKTLWELRTRFKLPARLVLVGRGDPLYRAYLKTLILKLGLDKHVQFKQEVSNEELKLCYEQADFFVSLSEHEGFCVPLVEAMKYQVPIVALCQTGVQTTLGPAGVGLKESDPKNVAWLIQRLSQEQGLRDDLIPSQNQRYKELASFHCAQTMREKLIESMKMV